MMSAHYEQWHIKRALIRPNCSRLHNFLEPALDKLINALADFHRTDAFISTRIIGSDSEIIGRAGFQVG